MDVPTAIASQTSYIFGDKPGEKITSLINTIDRYIHYFDAWSKIKNIEALLNIEWVRRREG
jgi:hypothetical protein